MYRRRSCIFNKFFCKLGGAKNGQLLRFFLHCIEKLYPQYLFFMKNIILCLICDPKSSFSWMGLLLERVFYFPWSPLEGSSIRIFKEGSYNREGSSIGVYTVFYFCVFLCCVVSFCVVLCRLDSLESALLLCT